MSDEVVRLIQHRMDTATENIIKYLRSESWTEPGGMFYAPPRWWQITHWLTRRLWLRHWRWVRAGRPSL